MFPGVFLRRSDEYMSTILEYVSALKKFKRVFVLTGHGSADAISNLLDWRKSSHFSMELAIPGIKGSLLKDLTCEDLLERHTVLDVMHYGLDIF
jgi:hypothetical protein